MRLIITVGRMGALVHETQLQHRKTAIEYAIAGATGRYEENTKIFGDDFIFNELETIMRDWVIETILQGAYLREYHLWEKDCKEYFREMARRNGASLKVKNKSGQSFPDAIESLVTLFDVVIPAECFAAIKEANKRANIMKHDEGLTTEHFIKVIDYEAAMEGFEQFWSCMMEHEVFVSPTAIPDKPLGV